MSTHLAFLHSPTILATTINDERNVHCLGLGDLHAKQMLLEIETFQSIILSVLNVVCMDDDAFFARLLPYFSLVSCRFVQLSSHHDEKSKQQV